MGVRNCKETHILDNTIWLRDVIQQIPKLKKNVKTFESFTIEPFVCRSARVSDEDIDSPLFIIPRAQATNSNQENDHTELEERSNMGIIGDSYKKKIASKIYGINCFKYKSVGNDSNQSNCENDKRNCDSLPSILGEEKIKHFNVTICYKNGKEKAQKLHWIIKTSSYTNPKECVKEIPNASLNSLVQEINIYQVLIAKISRYLKQCSNKPQAKYLLNLPGFVHAEYFKDATEDTRNSLRSKSIKHNKTYTLILEDILFTKECYPVREEQVAAGLSLCQFKVYLATLAQIHGVGISWRLQNKEEFLQVRGKLMFSNFYLMLDLCILTKYVSIGFIYICRGMSLHRQFTEFCRKGKSRRFESISGQVRKITKVVF